MLKNLIHKLSGTKSYEQLLKKSIEVVQSYTDNESSIIGSLARNEEHFRYWIDYLNQDIIEISKSYSKKEQILKLREKTVLKIEALHINKPLLGDEINENEKEIIVKNVFKDSGYEDALIQSSQNYIYAEACIACYRLISKDLGDASKNDWFPMYCDLYEQFITQIYEEMISKGKNEVNVLGALLPTYKQALDETREKVIQGYQWEYDREKNKEEEKERQIEEDALKPPLVKVLSNHQIEELSEFLCERYRKAINGELYKIEGHSPTDIANVLFVDTGVMLIALSECVEDFDTAKISLKKVLFLAFSKLNLTDDIPETANEVPIHMQIEIYNTKDENENNSWLHSVCLLATVLMYGVDSDLLSKEESEELGRISFKNINDVWSCYVTVMNVFGHEMDTDLFDRRA